MKKLKLNSHNAVEMYKLMSGIKRYTSLYIEQMYMVCVDVKKNMI